MIGGRSGGTFSQFFDVWKNGTGYVCTMDRRIIISTGGGQLNGDTGWKSVSVVIARSSESVNVVKGDFENKVTSATKQWSDGPIDGKWYEYLGIQ